MTQEQENKILEKIEDSKPDGCLQFIIFWLLVYIIQILSQ